MGLQEFLGYKLGERQKVLSLMGPSGTGKSYSADFMQEFLGYKVAKQITTRAPRPDDKHYRYMSKEEFIKLADEHKILGLFAGDKETLQGNGYGYLAEEVMDQVSTDGKIILFPSAYELLQEDLISRYGTTDKVGLGFKTSESVRARALQCNKVFTPEELESRIETATTLTHIMEKYGREGVDKSFHLIYSDVCPEDDAKSKTIQLSKIVTCAGYNPEELLGGIKEYISR